MKFKHIALIILSGIILPALPTFANNTNAPKWLRNTAISPDGSLIAFTYKGDIFTVPANGGIAKQLTSGQSYDTAPVWSPDSKTIVFSSDREGSQDLYKIAAIGGTPVRITTSSGTETPLTFIDSNTVIYSTSELTSSKTSRHPTRLTRTYCVNINTDSPRPHLYLPQPIGAADAAADGSVIFHDKKGLENIYRKHERSSGTSDIWIYRKGKFEKETDFNGHDLNPVWLGDNEYAYLSEEDGTLNVYKVDEQGKRTRLTDFTRHPVRNLSAADNGILAFSWDGEIYTLSPGEKPVKVAVEIYADQYVNDAVKSYAKGNASYMTPSPDGKEVAFVLRGEVYVTDTKYKTTRRITDSKAQERVVSFSPDGKTLVYDSDRDGQWQIFMSKIKNPTEKRFTYATEIIEEPLYKGTGVAQQPQFSPDGKKVAFLEDRTTLKVIDLKTRKVSTVLDGKYNYSYTDGDVPFEWSPDSEWILISYFDKGGWNNSDIAAVKADGSRIIDLTESGYSDGNPKWAMNGRAITYETGRFGMKSHGSWGNQWDVVLMALDADAWDELNATEEEIALKEEQEKEKKKDDSDSKDSKPKKGKQNKKDTKEKETKKPIELDFDNRRHRTERLTSRSGSLGDYFVSPKGDKLYFTSAATEGDWNLYQRDLKKGETKLLVKGISGGIAPDAKGENIFVIGNGGMKKVDLAKGNAETIEFDAPYNRSKAGEREYIYEHMLRQVSDKFYDKNLHGVDWEYYGNHYREFLPYINNGEDFAILLSEILGELNASHTGSKYYGSSPYLSTSSLGAFFDETYTGDGLKVTEVVSGSPLSNKNTKVNPGDIILSIDGEDIITDKDYYPLLEGKSGRKTLLTLKRTNGKNDTISVRPLSQSAFNDLLYKRWVERNEKYVDSISGGRIGYVHVEGMNSSSFSSVYDRLLGKYRNADAVVVDTRWNGGGWLHNDLALLLNGKRYVDFVPRGQYIGSEPFSQWTKPSVMLVNEGNYSDAHGSPFTYQALGIGKVVGAPIPGTMTAVWWENQIDPRLIFGIPQVTSIDMNGNILENHQLNPDIIVYNSPLDENNGIDIQLETAVKALMKK